MRGQELLSGAVQAQSALGRASPLCDIAIQPPKETAETCSRLYGDHGARPTNGMPVECAVISMESDGSVRLQVARVGTVGQCWGLREVGGMPVHCGGWCTTRYAEGFNHWRLDITRQECSNSAVSKLVVRR